MLDHFSRSELACPTTGELRLATGFGEALKHLRVELDAPMFRRDRNAITFDPLSFYPAILYVWHYPIGKGIKTIQ